MDKSDAGRGLWIKGMQEGTVDKRDAGRGLWIKVMQEGDCGQK